MRSILSEARNTIPFFFLRPSPFSRSLVRSFLLKLAILFRIDYTITCSRAFVCITLKLPGVCVYVLCILCMCIYVVQSKLRKKGRNEKNATVVWEKNQHTYIYWMSKHKNVMWGNVWDIDIWIQKLYVFHLNSILYLLSMHDWHWMNDEDDNEPNVGKKHESWHKNKSHIDDWFLYCVCVCVFMYVCMRVHCSLVLKKREKNSRQWHHVNPMFTDVYKLCVACFVYLTKRINDARKNKDLPTKSLFLYVIHTVKFQT